MLMWRIFVLAEDEEGEIIEDCFDCTRSLSDWEDTFLKALFGVPNARQRAARFCRDRLWTLLDYDGPSPVWPIPGRRGKERPKWDGGAPDGIDPEKWARRKNHGYAIPERQP